MYPVRAGLHMHIIHYFQGSLVYLVASLVTGLYPHSSWNNIYIMYILNMTLRWHPWSGFNRSNVGRLGMVSTVKRDDFPIEIMPDDRGDFPAMCHDGWSSWDSPAWPRYSFQDQEEHLRKLGQRWKAKTAILVIAGPCQVGVLKNLFPVMAI